MLTFGDEESRGAVESETGIRPPWRPRASATSTTTSASRSRYDVATGSLREVSDSHYVS